MRANAGLPPIAYTTRDKVAEFGQTWLNNTGSALMGAAASTAASREYYDISVDEETYASFTPEEKQLYDDARRQMYMYANDPTANPEDVKYVYDILVSLGATEDNSTSEHRYEQSWALGDKALEHRERLQQGMGATGKFLTNAALVGADVLTDAALSALTGGVGGLVSMTIRSYGQTVSEARRNGDDEQTAIEKGIASAIIEFATEKFGGAFSYAYGKSMASDVLGRLFKNPIVRRLAAGGAEGLTESMGSALYIAVSQLEGWSPEGMTLGEELASNAVDMFYEFLIGSFVGVIGGDSEFGKIGTVTNQSANSGVSALVDTALANQERAENGEKRAPTSAETATDNVGDIQTPPTAVESSTGKTERLNQSPEQDAPANYTRREDDYGFSVRERGNITDETEEDFGEENFVPLPPDANVDYEYFQREALKQYGAEAEVFWRAHPGLREIPPENPLGNKNAWIRAKAKDLAYQKAVDIREEIFNIKDDRSIPVAQRLTELIALAEEEYSLGLVPEKRDWHIVDDEIVDANAASNTAVTGGRGKEYTSIKPAANGINPRKASAREEPPESVGARMTDEMKDALRGQQGADIISAQEEKGGTVNGRESVQGTAGTGQRGDGVSNAGRTFGTRSRDESKNSRADTSVQGVGNRHQRILQSESHSGGLKPVGGRKEGSISFDKDTREIVNPEGKDREWVEWIQKKTGIKARGFIGKIFSRGREKNGVYRSKSKEILFGADTPYSDSTKVHEALHAIFDKARGSRERTAVSTEVYDRFERSSKAPKVQKAFDEAKAIYYDRNYRARFEDNLSRIDRTKLSEADVFRLVQLAEEDAHARAKEEFLVGVAAVSNGLENIDGIKALSREVRKQLINEGVVDGDFFTSAPWSDPAAETDSDSDFGETTEDDGPLVFDVDESGALTDSDSTANKDKTPSDVIAEIGIENQKKPEAPPKSPEQQAKETFGAKYSSVNESVNRVLRSKDFVADKRFKRKVSKATVKAVENKVSALKKAITDFGNGLVDIDALSKAYEAAAKDSALSLFASKQVNAKLDYAKRCYEFALSDKSTSYDVKRFQNAADEAMKVVARRYEQANQAMINRLAFEEEAKRSAPKAFKKGIVGKAVGWYTSLQMNGPNLFRWVDGFDQSRNGIGYAMANAAEDAAAIKSIERVNGNKFFSELDNSEKMDAFLRGETSTGVKFGDIEINQLQAASIVSMYKTMLATSKRKFDKLKGFAFPDGKTAKTIKFELEEGESAEAAFSEFVSELEGALSDEARQYKKILDDVFAYYNPRLSETSEDVNGTRNRMFGYGKYFPLRYYKDGEVAEYNLARDLEAESDVDAEGNPIPPKIMLSRSADSGSFLLIEPVTEVANRYIEQASDYIAYAGFSQRLELMNMSSDIAPGVAETLSENFGDAFGKWMDDYVEDMKLVHESSKGREGLGQFLGDTVDALRKNLQQGALLFNPGTPIKQHSAYWTAMGILKPSALFKALGTNPIGRKKDSSGNAIATDRRLGNIDPTLNELLHSQDTWLGKLKSRSKIISFAADSIGIADSAVVDSLFTATIYDVAMDHPKMDKSSAQFKRLVENKFEELMLTTQSTSARSLGSALQRTKNPWLKIASMFRSQQTQELNKLIRFAGEYGSASGSAKSAAGKKLRQSIAGQAASYLELSIAQMAVNLLLHRLDRYEDEEDKLDPGKIFKSIAIDFAENAAGTAWLGENIAQWLIEEATGENEFYGISLGPVSTLKSLIDSLDWFSDNPTLSNLKRVVGNIGNLGGVPANNIFNIINSVTMMALEAVGSEASEYDDILKYLDAESRRMEIITGKTARQRASDFIRGKAPSKERQASYDAISYLIDASGRTSVVPTRQDSFSYDSVEYELDSKEQDRYYKTSMEIFYDMVDDIIASPIYSNADTETQEEIIDKFKEYSIESAKADYLKALGLDYDSPYSSEFEGIAVRGRDDNGVAKPDIPAISVKDLPEYFAMEAAYSSYNKQEDYDAVDKILHYLPHLSDAAQQQFRHNTSRSAVISAYEAGVSSEGYAAYKDARSRGMEVHDVTDGTNIAKLYGVVNSGLPPKEMDALAAHVMGVQGKKALKVYNEVRSSGRPITEAVDIYIARYGY